MATTSSPPVVAPPTAVALIGNPNVGKSTLFNALCGVRQKTGNYPGVTVERKLGKMSIDGMTFEVIDLPGTYSLAPRSPDEMVTVDVLMGRREDTPPPGAIVCVLDAANLHRNMYLLSQALELGRPTVLALTMNDVARSRGLGVDVAGLSRRLGLPVVAVRADKGENIDKLKSALAKAIGQAPPVASATNPFPAAFQAEVTALAELAQGHGRGLPRYLVERLLLDSGGYVEQMVGADVPLMDQVKQARARLASAGLAVPAVEAMARYGWVAQVLDGLVTRPDQPPKSWSDRLDRVLTHQVGGLVVFALLMFLVFMSIFSFAAIPMSWIDERVGELQEFVGGLMAEGALQSLVVDGVIAGFGAVVIFLPQILILFLFLAILEDCGYLARAAYLMDRIMVKVGLSGKSFIPLLSAHACAIPAVLATRVIEDRRDRLATMLVTPLMSCSARLPVYLLLIGAFVPNLWLGGWLGVRPLTMFAMYALGIVTAAGAALVFKRTILRGPTPPFVMELPPYKWPNFGLVLRRVLGEGWQFVRRAGTLIVTVAIVIWAALYYPHDPAAVAPLVAEQEALAARLETTSDDSGRAEIAARHEELEAQIAGEYQRQSYLGRLGRALEPAFLPLGWDWRIGSAALASFPAREVVVGVMGVMFNQGELDPGEDRDRARLGGALRGARWPDGRPLFTTATALSLMVFFALCSQCAATLAAIRRETGTWRWAWLTFVYMTLLAYAAAFVTYQVASRLGGG